MFVSPREMHFECLSWALVLRAPHIPHTIEREDRERRHKQETE
jgi:hypothetical protein